MNVDSPGPPNRGANYFNGVGPSASKIRQIINVPNGGGQAYKLCGWLGALRGNQDSAQVDAIFLDGSGNVLPGTPPATIGPVSGSDPQSLELREKGGTLPPGTEQVQIVVRMNRSGGLHNGFADNVSFVTGAGGGTPPSGGGMCPTTGGVGNLLPGNRTDQDGCEYDPGDLTRTFPAEAQPAVPQLVSTTPSCSWGCASFNSDWLNVSCSAGAGQGFASIALTENAGAERTGLLRIGNQCITVTQTGDQAGACVSGFSPSQIDVEAAGDLTGNVCTNVTTSTPDCVYSIDPQAAWITPRRNVFRGSQQVCFLVSPNPDPTPRSGTVQIGQNAVPLTINQPLGGTIGSPQIPPGAVIPTASGTPAALRGGSLTLGAFFSIFGAEGRDLGPRDRQKAEGYPLSRKLGGVQVEFRRNGVLIDTAFLVFAWSQQINGIVPSNEALLGEVDMVVVRNGVASNPRRTTIVRHNAAIFSVLGGRGPAIITNFIAQNNQPLNTRSLTAKPGQAITIWGKGGGRVLFPDQNAPIAGNLPCRQIPSEPGCQEYPFDVEIGGVLLPRSNLFYHGRSTCCSGLDQVVAILGDNVPFGCNVPVRVRAGGPLFGWSNAATMAITPDGSACSTVSNPIANLPATGGNHGTVLLANVDIRQNIDPRRVTADAALATFVAQQAGGDLGFDPILSTQPMGSCVVFDDLQDLSPLLGRTLPKVNLLSGRDYLDAGPQVTFTPPGGAPIVALPRDAVPGEGPYVFPSSFPDTTTQSMFLAGSTQVTIPGGSEVGPANFSVDFPGNVTWTNRDQLNSIDRDRPFTFSWSGGRADQEVVAFGLATDQESTATSAFFCRVSADRGGFMVDTPSLTNFLETQGGDLTGKSAYIGIASLPKIPSFFSANGLDLGWALPIKIEIKQVDVTLNGAGPLLQPRQRPSSAGWSRHPRRPAAALRLRSSARTSKRLLARASIPPRV